jgi:hypothetical protein
VTPETKELVMWAASGAGSLALAGATALGRAIWRALGEMKAQHDKASNETRETLAEQATAMAEQATKIAVIHTTLVGPTGTNGLNSEVGKLRSRVHDLGDDVQRVMGVQELHALRLRTVEDKLN